MGQAIDQRKPLSRDEVVTMLNVKVEATEKQWGKDYIYSKWARENRDKLLEKFDAGEVIPVRTVQYNSSYGNGTGDYEDVLYSDGSVKTCCYGYLD